MEKLYLLSGNGSDVSWWQDALPYFQRFAPRTLELPGFGANREPPCRDFTAMANAVVRLTEPGQCILACGINALPVLHAAYSKPNHFRYIYLLAPVGAFLWQRRLPAVMAWKPLRAMAHFLLARYPKLFRQKFSHQQWSDSQYRRMGSGYRRCRAFQVYFDIARAHHALQLFEWIQTPVHILWGTRDRISHVNHAPAWEAILARSPLQFSITAWAHYPYIDDPRQFVHYLEDTAQGFNGHSKAGRLRLAKLAGLPIPAFRCYQQSAGPRPADGRRWAVRSSTRHEDQKDQSNAGLSQTFLAVPSEHVAERVDQLLAQGVDDVVVQDYVDPQYAGVAFVRHIQMDIEWVKGHGGAMLDGKSTPGRLTLCRYGQPWCDRAAKPPFPVAELRALLEQVLRIFHYTAIDVEWAYAEGQYQLLQVRPITVYPWRRYLTSANIDELLKPQPGRITEIMQRRAAGSISHIYALWDSRVLEDNEPFTDRYADASYVNGDFFLARIKQWGLPSQMIDAQIGGQSPYTPFKLGRFIKSLPVFVRMLYRSRCYVLGIEQTLQTFQHELMALKNGHAEMDEILAWVCRFYVFVVQSNLVINAAFATAWGHFAYRLQTVYDKGDHTFHRVPFESDLASPREHAQVPALQAMPASTTRQRGFIRLGAPGYRHYFLSVREWFRDNFTKLHHQIHLLLAARPDHEYWFAPWPSPRLLHGGFWQNDGQIRQQTLCLLIYPGRVEGLIDTDIIVVDTIEPGQYRHYRRFKALVSRGGGLLSHGATLLREMAIPSAINPNAGHFKSGQRVRFDNGIIQAIEDDPSTQ